MTANKLRDQLLALHACLLEETPIAVQSAHDIVSHLRQIAIEDVFDKEMSELFYFVSELVWLYVVTSKANVRLRLLTAKITSASA